MDPIHISGCFNGEMADCQTSLTVSICWSFRFLFVSLWLSSKFGLRIEVWPGTLGSHRGQGALEMVNGQAKNWSTVGLADNPMCPSSFVQASQGVHSSWLRSWCQLDLTRSALDR